MALPLSERIPELSALHPADVADELQRIEAPEEALVVLRLLPSRLAALSLAELDPEVMQDLAALLKEEELVELLQFLPPSDTTDIVGELPEVRQEEVLSELPSEVASPVRDLLQYPEDTAGGIMGDEYTTLDARSTIGDALDRLREPERSQHPVSYLYVTDPEERLVGNACNLWGIADYREEKLIRPVPHRCGYRERSPHRCGYTRLALTG